MQSPIRIESDYFRDRLVSVMEHFRSRDLGDQYAFLTGNTPLPVKVLSAIDAPFTPPPEYLFGSTKVEIDDTITDFGNILPSLDLAKTTETMQGRVAFAAGFFSKLGILSLGVEILLQLPNVLDIPDIKSVTASTIVWGIGRVTRDTYRNRHNDRTIEQAVETMRKAPGSFGVNNSNVVVRRP